MITDVNDIYNNFSRDTRDRIELVKTKSNRLFSWRIRKIRKKAHFKICIREESEGGSAIPKLNIGKKYYNVLGTSSIYCTQAQILLSVTIGPKWQQSCDLNSASIFFQQKKIDAFDNDNEPSGHDIDCCRQLIPLFHLKSTYHCFRSNLLANKLRHPVSLFILCTLPGGGYGSSFDNECRSISAFFCFAFEYVRGTKKLEDVKEFIPDETTNPTSR